LAGSGPVALENYHILKWLKVNSWLSSEMKQILMRTISQTFSPPPQELIDRVKHYLDQMRQRWGATIIQPEEEFNEYKRYLGL
jgi:hypothetical protein